MRDAIYDAAIALFAKNGFDETTVEEVAEAAGISRRSFFRYFESKDDLLSLNTSGFQPERLVAIQTDQFSDHLLIGGMSQNSEGFTSCICLSLAPE